jgi:REP-associated tyrosine transposase
MSEYIHKKHNVSVLMYHIVCPTKYRRAVITEEVDKVLRDTCLEIAKRYEIIFLEIGVEKDHVHFLVQSVPTYSPTKIVRIIKSITAREVFKKVPDVKKQLWGGEFWTEGYFVSTVGKHGDEDMIKNYVKKQGQPDKSYKVLHKQKKEDSDQLTFGFM